MGASHFGLVITQFFPNCLLHFIRAQIEQIVNNSGSKLGTSENMELASESFNQFRLVHHANLWTFEKAVHNMTAKLVDAYGGKLLG